MNQNRGHETDEHRHMKLVIATLFTLLGYMVLFEEKLTDVVAWKVGGNRTRLLAIEAERSRRNVLRNVRRDLNGGCQSVLLVATGDPLAAAIRRCLNRGLEPHELKRVGVTTISRIEQAIHKIQNHENITRQ